jgi:AraC-like DNA-binding protein
MKKELTQVQPPESYIRVEKKPTNFVYDDFLKVFNEGFCEKKESFQIGSNQGVYSEFFSPGIHVWECVIPIKSPGKILVRFMKPTLQMIFCLSGNITYHLNNVKNVFEKSHHNTLFVPEGEILLEWYPSESTQIVIISLSEEFSNRYLPKDDEHFKAFIRSVQQKEARWLCPENMSLFQQGMFTLQDLTNSHYTNFQKRLFSEAKVIELLGQQLGQYEASKGNFKALPLKAGEIEKMYMVKNLILSNLSIHYSLIELAHQVGTNECYLKDHFKKVFGITVYGFTQKAKMERAKEMIIAGGKKISDIAKSTGYKYTSHFTSSFKKYYGVLPNKIKLMLVLSTLWVCDGMFFNSAGIALQVP